MNINFHGSLKSGKIESRTMWNISESSLGQYLATWRWLNFITDMRFSQRDQFSFFFLDWTLWYCFYFMWVGDLFNVTVQHSNVWARSTENNWTSKMWMNLEYQRIQIVDIIDLVLKIQTKFVLLIFLTCSLPG